MTTNDYIEDFKNTYLPADWMWRRGQQEAIHDIIEAYHAGTKTVILDAPVGSGKSVIGMAVAWILNQHKKKGFIIASDISLQEQYEKDFNSFKLNWGTVKGIDNYMCNDNMEKNSLGTCRIRNKPARSMYCYSTCPYFSARDRAAESHTALLNYAYWLVMMNYVHENLGDDSPFSPRDFTICDEAHKILDIVQNHYSPRIDDKTLPRLSKITSFFKNYDVRNHEHNLKEIKKSMAELFHTENQDRLHSLLKDIEVNLEAYKKSWEFLKDRIDEEYKREEPPKEWKEALKLCDWLKDFHCKVEDYVEIISATSTRNLIKNPGGEEELTFNCLEESYLMHKYFHEWTGFTLLMSATFADPVDYMKSIAINDAKYIKMDSNFDYSKSPIYFYNKRRMSYKQLDANLPWLYEKINEILDKHPEDSGIIHSASYHLTLKIFNNLSPQNKKRVIVYEGTEEKRKVLEVLKRKKGYVLMGPSLLEGLDLKGDWSRLQIFAKVPYLSLSDRFVKAKLDINPSWYRWKAVLNTLQGTGRSVRSETDWAVTYFLDGSLGDLIHSSRRAFPTEFLQRIVIAD